MQAFFESTAGKVAVIAVIVILLLLIMRGGKDSEKNDSGDATGIDAVAGGNAVVSEIYTIGGARVATMQRGLNIVKMSDGTFRKIFVK